MTWPTKFAPLPKKCPPSSLILWAKVLLLVGQVRNLVGKLINLVGDVISLQNTSHYRPQFFAFLFLRIILQNRDIAPLSAM